MSINEPVSAMANADVRILSTRSGTFDDQYLQDEEAVLCDSRNKPAKPGLQQETDVDIVSGRDSEDKSKTHCWGLLGAHRGGPACDSTDGPTTTPLMDWLETPIFAHLTSHHPLYSPCSIPPFLTPGKNPASHSPFVQRVLATIKQNEVKMLITSATGE